MQVIRKHRILPILLCIVIFVSFSFTMSFAEDSTETASKKIVSSAFTDREDVSVKNIPAGKEAEDSEESADIAVKHNELKNNNKDSFFIDGEPGYEDDYIDWNCNDDFILYKGEELKLDFSVYDTWQEYNTIPAFDIWSLESGEVVFTYNPADSDLVVTNDDWDNYKGQIDIGSADLETGYYFIAIQAMPCSADGVWAEDLSGFEIPEEYVDFTIEDLQ